jgi:hypothetical protein
MQLHKINRMGIPPGSKHLLRASEAKGRDALAEVPARAFDTPANDLRCVIGDRVHKVRERSVR